MSYKSLLPSIACLLALTGCDKYYVTIKKEPIDRQYLASTFVGSPDPLQDKPPLGQILFVEWSVAGEDLAKNPYLALEIIYGDWSEERFVFPIDKRRGLAEYALKGKKYHDKEGLFSYRALVKTESGDLIAQWSEQMWTPVIYTSQEESAEL